MILVAAPRRVYRIDPRSGAVETGGVELGSIEPGTAGSGKKAEDGLRPTFIAADPHVPGRAWLATRDAGVFRSDDAGERWRSMGLEGESPNDRRLMTVVASPARADLIWVGAEPSRVWRSDDAGESWVQTADLETLPSSSTWAFPPRPDTHHVRWIGCHPHDPDHLWVAIEAGALVTTDDGGQSWRDRVEGGPYDTHELAVHPDAPDTLRVAAGDGYYESHDGGASWHTPREGLRVGYLRSVAIDPGDSETVVVSAASAARRAYSAGRSDGRVYRRSGATWTRITDGFPDEPSTIAPLLEPGHAPGELWAADERGVHRSDDGGRSWENTASFPEPPDHLRGLAILP